MKNIYIAGSFTTEQTRKALDQMIALVRKAFPNDNLYIPMEYKVEEDYQNPDGSWHLSNSDWARKVFEADRNAIVSCDMMIAMYTGHIGTTGTSWELGFAYGSGIPIVLYIPEWVEKNNCSLMVLNGAGQYMDSKGKIHKIDSNWLEKFNQK